MASSWARGSKVSTIPEVRTRPRNQVQASTIVRLAARRQVLRRDVISSTRGGTAADGSAGVELSVTIASQQKTIWSYRSGTISSFASLSPFRDRAAEAIVVMAFRGTAIPAVVEVLAEMALYFDKCRDRLEAGTPVTIGATRFSGLVEDTIPLFEAYRFNLLTAIALRLGLASDSLKRSVEEAVGEAGRLVGELPAWLTTGIATRSREEQVTLAFPSSKGGRGLSVAVNAAIVSDTLREVEPVTLGGRRLMMYIPKAALTVVVDKKTLIQHLKDFFRFEWKGESSMMSIITESTVWVAQARGGILSDGGGLRLQTDGQARVVTLGFVVHPPSLPTPLAPPIFSMLMGSSRHQLEVPLRSQHMPTITIPAFIFPQSWMSLGPILSVLGKTSAAGASKLTTSVTAPLGADVTANILDRLRSYRREASALAAFAPLVLWGKETGRNVARWRPSSGTDMAFATLADLLQPDPSGLLRARRREFLRDHETELYVYALALMNSILIEIWLVYIGIYRTGFRPLSDDLIVRHPATSVASFDVIALATYPDLVDDAKEPGKWIFQALSPMGKLYQGLDSAVSAVTTSRARLPLEER